VVFAGHANAPPGTTVEASTVRIGLFADTIDIPGESVSGAPLPFVPARAGGPVPPPSLIAPSGPVDFGTTLVQTPGELEKT
jgi:hypothetical protein